MEINIKKEQIVLYIFWGKCFFRGGREKKMRKEIILGSHYTEHKEKNNILKIFFSAKIFGSEKITEKHEFDLLIFFFTSNP